MQSPFVVSCAPLRFSGYGLDSRMHLVSRDRDKTNAKKEKRPIYLYIELVNLIRKTASFTTKFFSKITRKTLMGFAYNFLALDMYLITTLSPCQHFFRVFLFSLCVGLIYIIFSKLDIINPVSMCFNKFIICHNILGKVSCYKIKYIRIIIKVKFLCDRFFQSC